MRLTDCSSTPPASRFTAAQAAEKGALAHGIGHTKCGRNTKLHAVCDGNGRPFVLLLTPGSVHDCKPARQCVEAMPPAAELVADKDYDSKALRDWLEERGTTAVILPCKNRTVQYDYNKDIYRQRNVIERMFCRLKDWRRIETRLDRNIKNFMAADANAADAVVLEHKMRKSRLRSLDGQIYLQLKKLKGDIDPRSGLVPLRSSLVFENGTINLASPIILDLDGDGRELKSAKKSKARFDMNGDGIADADANERLKSVIEKAVADAGGRQPRQ